MRVTESIHNNFVVKKSGIRIQQNIFKVSPVKHMEDRCEFSNAEGNDDKRLYVTFQSSQKVSKQSQNSPNGLEKIKSRILSIIKPAKSIQTVQESVSETSVGTVPVMIPKEIPEPVSETIPGMKVDDPDEERLAKLREEISKPLSYDPLNLPKSIIKDPKKFVSPYATGIAYIEGGTSTKLREDMPDFIPCSIKDIKSEEEIGFEIPVCSKINPAKDAKAKIDKNAIGELRTSISKKYGERLNWSVDKTARDLMQNFYDGHNHTLEGVKFTIKFNPDEKTYKVKISGKGEYNHKDIELLGGGNKHENAFDAGSYGEGSKMITIKLLANHNVPAIIFSSADWKLTYKLGDKSGNEKDILYRCLEKLDKKQKGNYVEFKTKDEKLVEAILRSINYFYHPQNPDFKCPTFENKYFGFKYLGDNPNKDRGNIYIANQRFEANYAGGWNNDMENITVFFKTKPGHEVLDTGRDRTFIDYQEIGKLTKHYAVTMKNEELVSSICSLEGLWSSYRIKDKYNLKDVDSAKFAGVQFLKGLLEVAKDRNITINIPDNKKYFCIPYWERNENATRDLIERGYIPCHEEFRPVGMKTLVEVFAELRNYNVINPTEKQIKKIKIIDLAAEAIVQAMDLNPYSSKIILRKDVFKPVFIFDNSARQEIQDIRAEALIDNNKDYCGHWIDKDYLDNGNFFRVLTTRFHEICHKHGEDGSEEFSYKLTGLLAEIQSAIVNNPKLSTKLSDLQTLWNEL